MGKTVESYCMALEGEIQRWNGFARALRLEEREAFEQIMDACPAEGGEVAVWNITETGERRRLIDKFQPKI
jgi:hypothetical protein